MAISAVVADWNGDKYVNGSNETLKNYLTKARVQNNMNKDEFTLTAFQTDVKDGVTVNYKSKDYKFTVEIIESGNSAKVSYSGSSDSGNDDNQGDEIFAEAVIEASHYGDYVDYPIDLNGDGDTTNDWRIFYNNGTQVFIIAADYVPSDSEYLDLETAEMYKFEVDDPYSSLCWNNPINNVGHSEINETIANLFMYDEYYKAYPSSTNYSAKATVSLLNQSAWDGFKDENYAQFAVGGSTLEMWIASYNAKGYDSLYTNVNDTGYYVGNAEGTSSDKYWVKNDTNNGYNDTLYFPHQDGVDECHGYWLASPSAYHPLFVLYVLENSYVDSIEYRSSRRGRPSISFSILYSHNNSKRK